MRGKDRRSSKPRAEEMGREFFGNCKRAPAHLSLPLAAPLFAPAPLVPLFGLLPWLKRADSAAPLHRCRVHWRDRYRPAAQSRAEPSAHALGSLALLALHSG